MSNHTIDSNKYHGKPCKNCGSTLKYKASSSCVACKSKGLWEKANRDKSRAIKDRWAKANPNYNCSYYQKNREIIKRRARRYYENNKEKAKERVRNYQKANPEKKRVFAHRRRAHKNNNKSEPYDFKVICEHYDNRCVRCGEEKPLTVDHITPISKGGPDIASNIQPLCRSCNSRKGVKYIDYRPDAGAFRWIQKRLLG